MFSLCGSVCSPACTATWPPSRPWRLSWMTQVIHAHAACTEAAPPDRGPAALARRAEVVGTTKRAPPAARCGEGPAGQAATLAPGLRPRGTCVGARLIRRRAQPWVRDRCTTRSSPGPCHLQIVCASRTSSRRLTSSAGSGSARPYCSDLTRKTPSPIRQAKRFARAHANTYLIDVLIDAQAVTSGAPRRAQPGRTTRPALEPGDPGRRPRDRSAR